VNVSLSCTPGKNIGVCPIFGKSCFSAKFDPKNGPYFIYHLQLRSWKGVFCLETRIKRKIGPEIRGFLNGIYFILPYFCKKNKGD
jgi:hypothetical protein